MSLNKFAPGSGFLRDDMGGGIVEEEAGNDRTEAMWLLTVEERERILAIKASVLVDDDVAESDGSAIDAIDNGVDICWHQCDQEGCDYKAKLACNLKLHKANIHDIEVRWHNCDQDGCDYKAKEARSLKKHKANIHDIDVRWNHCDQDGCDYKAKDAGNLKTHVKHTWEKTFSKPSSTSQKAIIVKK